MWHNFVTAVNTTKKKQTRSVHFVYSRQSVNETDFTINFIFVTKIQTFYRKCFLSLSRQRYWQLNLWVLTLSFSRSETFTSRTSGTRPCSPESTPWPPCCALWSPAPRTWPAVPPSASPCSGWTGWGWRQAWSSGSTSQSSDPTVGGRGSYFKPRHVFTVRFHSSSCSSTLTCFQP